MKTTQREASRREWRAGDLNSNPTHEQINAGSLQRIADACEKMGANWQALTSALESAKASGEYWKGRAKRLELRLRAQKAATTRARKREMRKGNSR